MALGMLKMLKMMNDLKVFKEVHELLMKSSCNNGRDHNRMTNRMMIEGGCRLCRIFCGYDDGCSKEMLLVALKKCRQELHQHGHCLDNIFRSVGDGGGGDGGH